MLSSVTGAVSFTSPHGLSADRLHDVHPQGPAPRFGEDRWEPRADVRIDAACAR